jgi:hypothetical protein
VGYGNFMSLSTILKVILWQSVSLLDALSVHGDNHRPVAISGFILQALSQVNIYIFNLVTAIIDFDHWQSF